MNKKIVIVLCLMFLFDSAASAEVMPPEWSEFAPVKYLNAQYQEYNFSSVKNVLLGFTVIGAPIALKRKWRAEEIDVSNYWVQRKLAFDNEVATCKSDSQNQSQCYMQVRNLELSKTLQDKYMQLMKEANEAQNNNAQQLRSQIELINNNLRNINSSINNK